MTPSKSEILAKAKAGVPPREIAPAGNRDLVYSVLREARRRGEDIPRFTGGGKGRPAGWKLLRLEPEVIVRLTPGAEARGISVKQMIADLLDVIASENLADAILDDGGNGDE